MKSTKRKSFMAVALALPLGLAACDVAEVDDLSALEEAPVATHEAAVTQTVAKVVSAASDIVARDTVVIGTKTWFVGSRQRVSYAHVGNFDLPLYHDTGIVVGRLNANGSLDRLFDVPAPHTGTFPFTSSSSGNAIVADGTGVIIGGGAANHLFLARIDADLTLDKKWGSRKTGMVSIDFGGASEALQDLARDSQGRVVGIGEAQDPDDASKARVATVRLMPDGTLDISYFRHAGANGVTTGGKLAWTLPVTTSSFDAQVAIAPHDFPVFAIAEAGGHNYLYRRDQLGALDEQLDGDGKLSLDKSGHTIKITSLATRADGAIYVGGSFDGKLAVWGLEADGEPDTSFASTGDWTHPAGGLATIDFSGSGEIASSLAFDGSHSRLYLAGTSQGRFAVAALRLDGTIDPSFGSQGKLATSFSPRTASAAAIALAGTDIVVGGLATDADATHHFAFARYEIETGHLNDPCNADGMCNGGLRCSANGSGSARFYVCSEPGGWVPPPAHGAPGSGHGCPGEGEACSAQPSGCSAGYSAPGKLRCDQSGRTSCVADEGTDYCGSCGGACGGCPGDACSATAPCGANLKCADYNPVTRRFECTAVDECEAPAPGTCWTPGSEKSCEPEGIELPELPDTPEPGEGGGGGGGGGGGEGGGGEGGGGGE